MKKLNLNFISTVISLAAVGIGVATENYLKRKRVSDSLLRPYRFRAEIDEIGNMVFRCLNRSYFCHQNGISCLQKRGLKRDLLDPMTMENLLRVYNDPDLSSRGDFLLTLTEFLYQNKMSFEYEVYVLDSRNEKQSLGEFKYVYYDKRKIEKFKENLRWSNLHSIKIKKILENVD